MYRCTIFDDPFLPVDSPFFTFCSLRYRLSTADGDAFSDAYHDLDGDSVPVSRAGVYTDRADLLNVLRVGSGGINSVGLFLRVDWESGRVCPGTGALSRFAAHERILRVSLNPEL